MSRSIRVASQTAIVVFLIGLGVAAGFLIGRGTGGANAVGAGSRGSTEAASAAGGFDVESLDVADPVERARRFMSMLETLGPGDFSTAAESLHGRADEWAEYEARLFVWAWSRIDHAEALEGALQWSLNLRDAVSYASVRSWARVNPIAAQEAVRLELDDAKGTLGTSLLSGLAAGWAESGDFDGALELIEARFPTLVHKEALTEMVIEEMLRVRGVQHSFAWAEQLAARNDDRAFLSIVFRKLGRNAVRIEPEATAAWLDRFQGDPSYMSRARRAAAVMWGRDDASRALGWTLAQPKDNERRASGLTTILTDWVTRDDAAALAWLRAAPRDPALDEGVVRSASIVARRSPGAALEWVELVGDPGSRQEALVTVVARWVDTDPSAAARWIASAGLSKDLRRRITERAAALP